MVKRAVEPPRGLFGAGVKAPEGAVKGDPESAYFEAPAFQFIVRLDGNMAQYGPDIRRFIDAMVYKLERNAAKGKWEGMTLDEAFSLLQKEIEELRVEVKGDQNMVRTMLEAADVANFALIIASIVMERGR